MKKAIIPLILLAFIALCAWMSLNELRKAEALAAQAAAKKAEDNDPTPEADL
jgi:hypothetical protein